MSCLNLIYFLPKTRLHTNGTLQFEYTDLDYTSSKLRSEELGHAFMKEIYESFVRFVDVIVSWLFA